MVNDLNSNLEYCCDTLANRAKHRLQAVCAGPFAGQYLEDNLSQGVLVVLIVSDEIGIIMLVQADDGYALAVAAQYELL